MKEFVTLSIALVMCARLAPGQSYQGPANGSIAGGASVSTNNFGPDRPGDPGPLIERTHNRINVEPWPPPSNMPNPTGPEGSNLIEYNPLSDDPVGPPPIVIRDFSGIPQTNSIPPDPHCAAGPNHIMAVVNTSFRIADKQGNTLKTISATSWFNNVFTNSGAFDPKVHYDHFAGRWIMVWLQQDDGAQTSNYLLSVSDDDDPIGTWYSWALPGNVNGTSPSGNWADYQGVGFDNQAIYFTSNQFSFSGFFDYTRIRIIGKAQLYANNAGPVTWTDIWGLTDLFGNSSFGVRPAVINSLPNEYYLLNIPNFTSGSFFVLYRLTNPLTSPVITAVHVPVVAWTIAPNANQLGGSTIPIEGGRSQLRHEPVYMDSSIWAVHSVANGAYSSVRYVRISTITNTTVEDGALGAPGFWHIYPALKVDKDRNVAITFSRSGLTEYIGAGMSWRLNTDPVSTLRPTTIFRPGEANYVKDFGSGRNRWGDYMGIALDPVDRNNFWMFTEYATSPVNTWATWWLNTRLVPFSGARISSTLASKDFGLVEVGTASDTVTVSLFNVGSTTLTISSITKSQPSYSFLGLPSIPANLATYDSVTFRLVFLPTAHGAVNDTIVIVSNDGTNPTMRIPLQAKGVSIGRAQVGVMYATNLASGGSLYSINISTGAATPIGPLGVTGIDALSIRPSTQELYATSTTPSNTGLYRVSSSFGDALPFLTIPIGNLRAIAFTLAGDTLYAGATNGRLYRINLATGDTIFIGTAPGIAYASLVMQPGTGLLWAGVRPALAGRERIFTVNPTNGDTTFIGSTGITGHITPGLAFDALGTLYGITGSGSQINNFITINTTTGVGTLVGATGLTNLSGLAYRSDSLTAVGHVGPGLPETFVLSQNYPNPFNPKTQIRFGLPLRSDVTLTIYNVVGQEIARLVEGERPAGYHEISWSGTNSSGSPVASGIYFYKLNAVAQQASGTSHFSDIKKMLLIK